MRMKASSSSELRDSLACILNGSHLASLKQNVHSEADRGGDATAFSCEYACLVLVAFAIGGKLLLAFTLFVGGDSKSAGTLLLAFTLLVTFDVSGALLVVNLFGGIGLPFMSSPTPPLLHQKPEEDGEHGIHNDVCDLAVPESGHRHPGLLPPQAALAIQAAILVGGGSHIHQASAEVLVTGTLIVISINQNQACIINLEFHHWLTAVVPHIIHAARAVAFPSTNAGFRSTRAVVGKVALVARNCFVQRLAAKPIAIAKASRALEALEAPCAEGLGDTFRSRQLPASERVALMAGNGHACKSVDQVSVLLIMTCNVCVAGNLVSDCCAVFCTALIICQRCMACGLWLAHLPGLEAVPKLLPGITGLSKTGLTLKILTCRGAKAWAGVAVRFHAAQSCCGANLQLSAGLEDKVWGSKGPWRDIRKCSSRPWRPDPA
mmetsp:Transcript_67498/g.161038  ORF Transcript_67498/g.161038 Transcript_67498/m.161038 type:complete len:435 (+) Transcript_67498:684-1988(+)